MSVTVTTTQQLKQGTAKFWIVLVGVNRYLDSNILNLRYCANDCKELAEALKIATGEFQHTEIISLYDGGNLPPERSQIIESIQQFRFAKPEDTVLFYFSGHGYLNVNNQPVLCVADTRLDNLAETGLKLDFLLDELSQCRAQRQLVWLDACQSREQQSDKQIKNPTRQLSAALKEQADKSPNFYAMLSCNKQERSWEIEELQHGLFTFCLIEGLRGKAANSKGQIDADGLFDYIERISKRIIKDKKRSVDGEDLSKALDLSGLSATKPKRQISKLPANASQTPQRIIQGGGKLVFLIGLAAPINNRQALIIDRLSNSEATIGLCKLLQAQGNFAVEYRYLRDKQQWQLQQDIVRYLAADNRTVLLYLSGTIESTADRGYELVGDGKHRINLSWLAKELQASLVKEIVVIANITKATENTPSLESILQLNYDLPLCLIEATSRSGDRQFLARLVTTLESAAQAEREFWVTDLISPLQKWSLEQPDIKVTGWWGTVGLIEILSVEVQRSDNRVFDIEICPYKSLEAFTQDDAYFFHGREELVDKIIEKLKSNSFLAVVGASGSGKSSVVRAGVIPKLVTNGLNTSQSQQTQACQTWVMLPGDNPFTALARTIAPNEPKLIEGILHAGIKGFVDWLRQQPQALSVLVIDQFEELFTIADEKETERDDFIDLIVGAIKQARDIFKVIITLRGDFINECLNLSEIAPLMEQNEILVPVKSSRLEDEQYRQIIAQPAQKVGLSVEEGLMAVLLEELKDGSLPLLQYALEELWQKRREGKLSLKDYQQHIGRLGQFLSEKAEATYQNLNQLQQECAQSVFLSLVYLAQEQDKTNKDTRRRLLKSDLRVSKYKDTLNDTLQALVNARLIVVSGEDNSSLLTDSDRTNALAVADKVRENTSDRDQDTIEIAHEILIDNWKTLKWWIDKNRDKYRLIREINQSASKWKQNGKQDGFLLSKGALAKYEEFYIKYANELSPLSDRFMDASIQARDKADKLAKRRQRQIIGGLTGGITILAAALVFALGQLRKANINEIDALNNSTEALLALDRQFDALITALKAASRNQTTVNKIFKTDNRTQIQTIARLEGAFNKLDEINRFENHEDKVLSVNISPDGQTIASSGWRTVKLWNLQGQLLHNLEGYEYNVESIEFSPDGQTIASSGWRTVKLWNLQGQLLHNLKGHTKIVSRVKFSPDGQTIASVSEDRTIKIWNLQGKLLHTLKHRGSPNFVEFSPDGQIIASGSDYNKIKLWNPQGRLLRTLEGHTQQVTNVEFSPNKQIIASASKDETVKLWNFQGQLLDTFEGHTSNINAVVFSPDGQIIASASDDDTVKLWNLKGQLLDTFEGHTNNINAVVFSPDGQIIASASDDDTVKLWNLKGQLLDTFEGHSDNVNSIIFSPNGKTLASASDDFTVRIWNVNRQSLPLLKDYSNDSDIDNVEFSSDGQTIASSNGKTIKLWNLKKRTFIVLKGHTDDIYKMNFSPDGQILASVSGGTVKLWNLQGQLIHTLDNHTDFVHTLEFSPDSQTLASIGDGAVKLWNLKGKLINTLGGSQHHINAVRFSPDGQTIASILGADSTVKLWSLDGNLLYTLGGHSGLVNDIEFSPDGRLIASAGNDKIKLWNTRGKLLYTLEGHQDHIRDLNFSPNGKTLASASEDKTVRLWNLQGQLIHTVKGHKDDVDSVEFSSDGKTLASVSGGTVRLWNLQGQLIHTFEEHSSVDSVKFSSDGKTLALKFRFEQIELWSLDLNEVMSRGCDWVRDYLENNPNVSEEDRKICDGY